MLPITVYNQKGGQAKTTVTRDLAAAYAELGLDVLIVDFDSQDMSISNYLAVDEDKTDQAADDLTLHLIEQPKGDFEDLIRSVEYTDKIDVLPSHKRLGEVRKWLNRHEDYLQSGKPDDWEYPRYERFFTVLDENNVADDYDVMLVDPGAKADEAYYLALYATRNIIIPATTTRAGYESINGVRRSAEKFSDAHGIDIKTLATVPTFAQPSQRSTVHKKYLKKVQEEYRRSVYFKDIGAFENAEGEHQTIFEYFEDRRVRSYQQQLCPKFRTLAAIVLARSGRDIPPGVWTRDDLWFGDEHWTVDESLLPKRLQKQDTGEAEADAAAEVV